jgi:SAM-dependent methyltransferase
MYARELALIHDKYFGHYARQAAKDILPVIKKYIRRGETVLELGCGSGILSKILFDARYAIVGIDISPNMIRLACRRAPGAAFRVGSMWSARFPRSECVVSIGETINYIKARSRPSLARLFRRVGAALKPNGLFIFDCIVQLLPARKTFEAGKWRLDVTTDVDRDHVRRQIDISIMNRCRGNG